MDRSATRILVAGLLAAALPGGGMASVSRGGEPEPLTFEHDIRPIFRAHCFDCHGATEQPEGNLDLRLKRFLLAGGDSGPAIVPGQPEASYLLQRIGAGEMPPGEKKVTAKELLTLQRWVAAGAPTARAEPDRLEPGIGISAEERQFWSFQPIVRPEVPKLADSARARSPIDHFVLRRLQEVGLSFSPDADDLTLLLRASFDLTGLPPTPAEVESYLADDREGKYERLLDRLLASPRYGERWARHWLDIAGYADSEGATPADADRPWAYQYRDYVIRALNEDKPLDRFIQEQLAGDEMVPPPSKNLTAEQQECLEATGFLRMAADGTGSGGNTEKGRNRTITDTLQIVSTTLLGLSVSCAQCHDHRYDPIRQRDYYRLRAIFEPAFDWQQWRTPAQRRISLYTDTERATAARIEAEAQRVVAEKAEKSRLYLQAALEKELDRYQMPLRETLRQAYRTTAAKRTAAQITLLKQYPSVNITPGNLYQYNQAAADKLKKLAQKIEKIRAKKPPERFLRALTEIPHRLPETHLFHRGDYRQPQQAVGPAALAICCPPGQRKQFASQAEGMATSGRRLAYARWLTSGQHPLVARVLVNRIWLHHFGKAIVGTPSDFGALGERPTHPALLDWLARELTDHDWNLKRLHKLIMMSTVYRQASTPYMAGPNKKGPNAKGPVTHGPGAEGSVIDGANRLYWKKPIRRLEAEVLYDRILATCGLLENRLYGPPVPIQADDTGQTVVQPQARRRAIYVKVRRTQPVALLQAFDAPVMVVNCQRRPASTVPTQSLMLMNSPFILAHAQKFAERICKLAATEDVSNPAAKAGQAPTSAQSSGQANPSQPDWSHCVGLAWRWTFGRLPSQQEQSAAEDFLQRQFLACFQRLPAEPQAKEHPSDLAGKRSAAKARALASLCQVLFSANEFLYVD